MSNPIEKKPRTVSLYAFLLVIVMGISFSAGIFRAANKDIFDLQKEAVERGYAKWVVGQKFEWIEP